MIRVRDKRLLDYVSGDAVSIAVRSSLSIIFFSYNTGKWVGYDDAFVQGLGRVTYLVLFFSYNFAYKIFSTDYQCHWTISPCTLRKSCSSSLRQHHDCQLSNVLAVALSY